MSKPLRSLCMVLLLVLLIALSALRGDLPMDRQHLIAKKYGAWSGVLRVWCFEGWQPGAGASAHWFSRCVAAYEKSHPGIYIQSETVSEETMRGWNSGFMTAPDLLLFPPGLLSSPQGLVPLDPPDNLLDTLARRGDWDGICFALPSAMGGYARLDAPSNEGGLMLPEPDAYHLWNVARATLTEEPVETADPAPASPDLDLGLPAAATANQYSWRRFANGEGSALLATQREITRLSNLRAQGKGPDWVLGAVSPFTDQILFVAVPRGDDPVRQRLATEFAAGLLSEDSQGELHRAGLFAVTDASSGYGPSEILGKMEAMLRRQTPLAPRAFGLEWRAAVDRLVGETRLNSADAYVETLQTLLE